jgi:hypothetical protein
MHRAGNRATHEEQPGVIRTTITIPDDLKRRMDEGREAGGDFNWSAVASKAFEARLGEFIAQRGTSDLLAIAARMKLYAEAPQLTYAEMGRRAGADWVRKRAVPDQLRRLELFDEATWTAIEAPDDYGNSIVQEAFYHTIIGRAIPRDGIIPTVDDGNEFFWMLVYADIVQYGGIKANFDEAEFVRSFAAGALALWAEVKKVL